MEAIETRSEVQKFGCLAVFAIIVVAYIALNFAYPSNGPRVMTRNDACFMSQKFVRENLKAPSTAKFPPYTEANCNATQAGLHWKVRSYVDAENSFGAMIRSDYGVEMSYNPESEIWTLLDIAIVSP